MKRIKYSFRIKTGECLTRCPHRHITREQKEAWMREGENPFLTPNSPWVASASCQGCEFYHGDDGSVLCGHEDNETRKESE